MKIVIGQLNPVIGNCAKNSAKIIETIAQAKKDNAELVVFSELAICGYSPDDLLFEPGFIEACERALEQIINASKGISVIVGTPRRSLQLPGKPFHNSAAIIVNGELIGFQDKCLLPTYDVFDEWRYFEPVKSDRLWLIGDKRVGITICEDIWPAVDPFCQARYEDDPLQNFVGQNLDLLVNLSASPYSLGKIERRLNVAKKVANRLHCQTLIVNQVGGQAGLLFDGSSVLVSAQGELLYQAPSFTEARALLMPNQELKESQKSAGQELYEALCMGVKDYFYKTGFTKACLGLSGGIDSAVVACIAKEALGSENVLAVSMPSIFTSLESREDASLIAQNLAINLQEISIEQPVASFLEVLEPHFGGCRPDVTEENLQSRVRATLLMALANKLGYLVLNTGNKSELAMGYTTLYGDGIGSIGVLGDLLKCQVYQVAEYINSRRQVIPERVMTKAPTAELKPNQKDSDTLPEYAILDPIIDEYVVHNRSCQEIAAKRGLDSAFVHNVIKKIHQNEYKRRQLPFSLRVSEKAFSSGRCVPIVQGFSSALCL